MIKLIEINSPGCGVCKMMEPMIKVALEPFPSTVFETHGTDTPEGQALCEAYNIRQVPTFIYEHDGNVVRIIQGPTSIGEVRNIINQMYQDEIE